MWLPYVVTNRVAERARTEAQKSQKSREAELRPLHLFKRESVAKESAAHAFKDLPHVEGRPNFHLKENQSHTCCLKALWGSGATNWLIHKKFIYSFKCDDTFKGYFKHILKAETVL